MNGLPVFSFRHLLLHHGYLLLSVYVFAVALGLPIPADPVLLLIGAMVGDHRYSFAVSLLAAVFPTLAGDMFWYELGRFRGRSVVALLCKLSLEPDSCVRKSEAAFAKHGAGALLFAKFVPGMTLVAVSFAGIGRMRRWLFLLADAAGCSLWAGAYLFLGTIFYRQVDSLILLLGLFGRRAGLVILSLVALYIAAKYLQRRRFIRKLRTERITPQQARELIESEDPVTVIDLRHPSEVEREGMKILGALVLRPDELRSRSGEIPRDQQIILYCT
ncbi:MAG: VTT domain-containing protein [Acidobacteriaceae bacterium]|nr:VTT domain-containing protein [Acidobacteriaceae bacterium]MBV9294576.1 VTT domain-containing protein [Acidobacteriaceae bacterium]